MTKTTPEIDDGLDRTEDEFMDERTCEEGCGFRGQVFVEVHAYPSGGVEYWECPQCHRVTETLLD